MMLFSLPTFKRLLLLPAALLILASCQTQAQNPAVTPDAPLALDGEAFAGAMKEPKALVVDLRAYPAFGEGHIAGATNIGARGDYSDWIKKMIPADSRPLAVLAADEEAAQAAKQFAKAGIAAPLRYLRGGMASWKGATAKLPQKSVADLKKALDAKEDLVVLDVRKDAEWEAEHIRDARHFLIDDLAKKTPDLPKNQPIAIFCGSGYRSSIAGSILQARGFTHLFNVPGGVGEWQKAEYELVKD